MKTLIILILIYATSFSMVHAQINRPKINTKTGELIRPPRSNNGIKYDFKNIKSVGALKKIDLPYIEISPEKLMAKPQRSWRVGPLKITDGSLAVQHFTGTYHNYKWTFYDEFISLPIIPGVESNLRIFPVGLTFRTIAGGEYLLKLKHLGPYIPQSKIIVKINDEAQNVSMNRNSEFIIYIMEETSKNITISFTGLLTDNLDSHSSSITFSEILLEKIFYGD